MVKRANPVVRWNAPKRRRMAPKITLAQLPPSVRPEVKFSDRATALTNSFSPIEARPDEYTTQQGDDGDQMTGSEVFLKSIDYTLSLPSTGWSTCRVSVIIPRDPSISPTVLTPHFRYSHREFIVLHDEVFSINEKNHCRIKRKLDLKQKWSVTGTTITEGNVYVVSNIDTTLQQKAMLRTYYTDP